MEIVDFVPVCGGGMKKYRRKGTYHKLGTEVRDQCSVGVHQPKIRLSINIWKKLSNAYVQAMLKLAEHVAHFNNGEICFLKKTQDDEVHLLLAS